MLFESDTDGWAAGKRDRFDLFLMVVVALAYLEMADAAVLYLMGVDKKVVLATFLCFFHFFISLEFRRNVKLFANVFYRKN